MFTDHSSLINIFTGPPRWLEKLSDFDMEVVHIKGIVNCVADALSRQSWSIPETAAVPTDINAAEQQSLVLYHLIHGACVAGFLYYGLSHMYPLSCRSLALTLIPRSLSRGLKPSILGGWKALNSFGIAKTTQVAAYLVYFPYAQPH